MSRYLLDTNAVSHIAKRRSRSAQARLAALNPDDVICISAITEAELRYGLAKQSYREPLYSLIDEILGKFEVLSWGKAEARVYGDLRAKMEASGTSLGSLDMLIGAHALTMNAVLVTSDKAFSRIENLTSVNWATDIQ